MNHTPSVPPSAKAPPKRIRVLIVDDSAVIRGMVARSLEGVTIISDVYTAVNGQAGIEAAKQHLPDVIVLDIEMPIMDGITAIPHLLKAAPNTKIIMSSSLTQHQAPHTFQALQIGASDYIPKPTSKDPDATKTFYRELVSKIIALCPDVPAADVELNIAPKKTVAPLTPPSGANIVAKKAPEPDKSWKMRLLCVGASTGGPQTLVKLFSYFKGTQFKMPIVVVVHMPAAFTATQAQQIAKVCDIPAQVVSPGMLIKPGEIYVAEGGKHLEFDAPATLGGMPVAKLTESPPVHFCRPAVDVTLASLSEIYGGQMASIVLTGMGGDGAIGSETVAKKGGQVLVQERSSCVVWGMPRAVLERGVPAQEASLEEIAKTILRYNAQY